MRLVCRGGGWKKVEVKVKVEIEVEVYPQSVATPHLNFLTLSRCGAFEATQ